MKEITETELKSLAQENAKTIMIRSYVNGSSYDNLRDSTEEESKVIYSILYGALLAIRWRSGDIQAVKDAAEFIAGVMLRDSSSANCYDTIYNRIQDIFNNNMAD